MEAFNLYYVVRTNILPGKGEEAAAWWREKGHAVYASMPGVKSVKAYGVQFGLGGSYIEAWLHLENYAALDRMDVDFDSNPQKYAAFGETIGIFEGGSSRVMGDWPESHWSPPED